MREPRDNLASKSGIGRDGRGQVCQFSKTWVPREPLLGNT